jgi:hypothetical protein
MNDLMSSYFFVLHLLSQGLSILPDIFLRKGIMEPTLPCIFYCPLAWSCPQVFNSGLGMRLYEGRFGFWQGVIFMQNFWNFKVIPDTEIILTSIQSKLIWRNSSDSYEEVFRSDENSLFCFWWKMWSDVWLVKKRFKIQFEGYREPIFKALILFAWIMIWFAWERTAYRSRFLAFDQKGLDYACNVGLGYWLWRKMIFTSSKGV